MPRALFKLIAKGVFYDREVQNGVENAKAITDRLFELISPENPNVSYIDDEGRKVMRQPVALEHWREYTAQNLALLRSSAAIAGRALDVLQRHKRYLRCEYEAELRVGISTKMNKIREGVLNFSPRLEACRQLNREFEGLVEEGLPEMQMEEEMIKKVPQGDFFALDFMPAEGLKEVMEAMMEWAEAVAY